MLTPGWPLAQLAGGQHKMDTCLLRADFFNRVETQALACDYMLLLAGVVVHPLRKASGVQIFSPTTAKSLGIDHSAGVSGHKELDRLGLVIFDERTLEVFPADHFEVNKSGGKNLGWNKSAAFLAGKIHSEKVKTGRAALEAAAFGCDVVKSFSVPLNLISAAVCGSKLMTSDACVSLVLHCNEYLNSAEVGVLDIDLIASMTRQSPDAARAGIEMAVRRGVILVDWKTGEYFISKWFRSAGKLDYKNQMMNVIKSAVDISSKRLRKKVLDALSEQFKTTSEKLLEVYSIESTSYRVLDFILLHATLTSPQSTPPPPPPPPALPATKSDKVKKDDEGGFVFDKVKFEKAVSKIKRSGLTDQESATALKTVLAIVTTEAAADAAIEQIAIADIQKIDNLRP